MSTNLNQSNANVQAGWFRFLNPQIALAGALIISGLTTLVYVPSLSGGFIVDDERYLTENRIIASPDGLYRFWFTKEALDYYPVSNSSLWLEWRLWGMNPKGYRVTNLILHIATSLLVWRILRQLSIPGAFLAALIFAIHPINMECVAWISERKELLAAFFFMLSILWYLREEETQEPREEKAEGWKTIFATGRWYWLSLLSCVLAMLSKGSVTILPLELLLLLWWIHGRVTKRDCWRTLPFFASAVPLALVNVWYQEHSRSLPHANLVDRLVRAGAAVWFYFAKALLPINQSLLYPRWIIRAGNLLWWLPLLAALTVTALLWWQRNSRQSNWVRPMLFAWLFFCLALVPVMGFAEIGAMYYSPVADRYQHIAILGVITLLTAGWSYWHQHVKEIGRWATSILATGLVCLLLLLTWHESQLFGDLIKLYQNIAQKNPAPLRFVHNNLGLALSAKGQMQEAIDEFRLALQADPDYALAHNNLGLALSSTGHLFEAMDQFQQALWLKPDYPKALNNLGNVLDLLNRTDEAIEQYRQAIQLDPTLAETHYNLSLDLVKTKHSREALSQCEQALRLRPDYAKAQANLACAYADLGDFSQAVVEAQKALAMAQSQGQTALANQIQSMLSFYQSKQSSQ